MSHRRAVVLLCLLIGSAGSHARSIHYGAVADPALARCDDAFWRGQNDTATACYRVLLDDRSVSPGIRAEAAWALNERHTANGLFRAAEELDPGNASVLTRWGDLYAESHQDAEAMNIYREALSADPEYAHAMVGAAQVLAGSFSDAANTYLLPLLNNPTSPPGARVAARLLLARISLESRKVSDAEDHLGQAEALIRAEQFAPLEAYALRAAIDLLNGVTTSPWTARAQRYNPFWGDIYAVPAHFYVISRRYRQAIELFQRAVDVQPTLSRAQVDLGINLLRDNQVDRARRHLESAYELDPFSPIAVNTLRLLDSFDDFVLIQDPPLGAPGAEPPINLRLHREESASIAPYAIALARRSIAEFTHRYDFELREPVIIEMYPDHEDFAVRTAGLPGLGILGATFGYVVAMDSPSARSVDQFQWGTTLWHELAHVFTLEASAHLVPRWFSEGVSVFEEWRSGPTPGVRIPTSVFAAMRDARLLPIANLDEGFIRPSYPDQVIVSYMQAGLVCQLIDERYGDDKLATMLRRFRDGADTGEALESVLGISMPDFDHEFDSFLTERHGAVMRSLDRWLELHTELKVKASAADWSAVAGLAPAVIELHPDYVEADSPYLMLARAHQELGQREQSMRALESFWSRGGFNPEALTGYAEWLGESGSVDRAIDVLDRVAMVQPLDSDLHAMLGGLLLASGDADAALREFTIVVATDTHDRAAAYLDLARAQRATGDSERSRYSVLQALDIAPGYRPAQRLLLELMREPQGTDDKQGK